MKKSFCDKCGKDCTYEEREIKCCNNHYLWLDTSEEYGVGKDLLLCLDCKGRFSNVISAWLCDVSKGQEVSKAASNQEKSK